MNDDHYNMSLRKFLKQVGVTSQQAIESAVRDSGKTSGSLNVRVVLTSPDLDLEHVVDGQIELGGES